jgi:hypothetical protein
MVVAVAVVFAAIGWAVVRIVDAWFGRLIAVPWLSAAAMWLLAAATLYWAISSRPRLEGRPGVRPMPPIVAARTAVLAMAASRVGAVVAGFYGGVAIAMLGSLGTETGQTTAWTSALACAGSLVLVGAALWLERICRIPVDPDDTHRS